MRYMGEAEDGETGVINEDIATRDKKKLLAFIARNLKKRGDSVRVGITD